MIFNIFQNKARHITISSYTLPNCTPFSFRNQSTFDGGLLPGYPVNASENGNFNLGCLSRIILQKWTEDSKKTKR